LADGPSAEVAAAKARVGEYASHPSSVGITTPVSAQPPTGLKAAVVACIFPACQGFFDAADAAGEVLGWTVEQFATTGAPEDVQAQFTLAVESGPDLIVVTGFGKDNLGPSLDLADEAGIPVVTSATPDPAEWPYVANTSSVELFERNGRLLGDFIIAHSEGEANVLIAATMTFPMIAIAADAVKAAVEEGCSTCNVEVLSFEVTDIGTNLPGAVVSAIQRDPSIDYVVFQDGSFLAGVTPALVSAGLAEGVNLTSVIAHQANVEAIRVGDELASTLYSSPREAWASFDAGVRYLVGDDQITDPFASPTQLISPENAGELPSTGGGLGDLESSFRELWLLG
jgi:ribose transport system substrate-binding protein